LFISTLGHNSSFLTDHIVAVEPMSGETLVSNAAIAHIMSSLQHDNPIPLVIVVVLAALVIVVVGSMCA
jgi:hypothetical protein